MAKSLKQEVLGTGLTTALTIGSGLRLTYFHLSLHNTGIVNRAVDVHLVESGGSATDANKLWGHQAIVLLKPEETQEWRLDNLYLGPGVTVQWHVDAGSDVRAALSVDQIAATTPFIDIDPIELPASDTAVQFAGTDYQVSANRIVAAGSVLLHNTDSVPRQAQINLVQNGDSSATKNEWLSPTLIPGETQYYELDEFLPALAKVRWQAAAAGAITAKLSLFEESI